MTMMSDAFGDGLPIPRKHTCDGEDRSPALSWSEVPEGTQSFALICDDPDAPGKTWVHWVLYDLPLETRKLSEAVETTGMLAGGAKQGTTDFGRVGYGGPCPPGGVHRYYFKLYALDMKVGLPAGATKPQLLAAMKGHTLGEASLMGTYRR